MRIRGPIRKKEDAITSCIEWVNIGGIQNGLNLRSSDASWKLKESLLKFQATTWTDVHNRYESKIRI